MSQTCDGSLKRNGSNMRHICEKLFDNTGQTILRFSDAEPRGQDHSDLEIKPYTTRPKVVSTYQIWY